MFIGWRIGKRWFAGGNISVLWLLMYALMGGLVLYTLIVGHTP
jgi:hypothetical protein